MTRGKREINGPCDSGCRLYLGPDLDRDAIQTLLIIIIILIIFTIPFLSHIPSLCFLLLEGAPSLGPPPRVYGQMMVLILSSNLFNFTFWSLFIKLLELFN